MPTLQKYHNFPIDVGEDPPWDPGNGYSINYLPVHEGFTKYFEDTLNIQEKLKDTRRKRDESFVNPAASKSSAQTPDDQFKRLREGMDQFGFTRSSSQLEFHEAMLRSVVGKIYRADFASNSDRLMRENGWYRILEQVAISTSRQNGKTFSVAMFIATFADAVRGLRGKAGEQAVFSTGSRASGRLKDQVLDMLLRKRDLGYTDFVLDRCSKESLWIKFSDGTISKMFFYPSKAKICTLSLSLTSILISISPYISFCLSLSIHIFLSFCACVYLK